MGIQEAGEALQCMLSLNISQPFAANFKIRPPLDPNRNRSFESSFLIAPIERSSTSHVCFLCCHILEFQKNNDLTVDHQTSLPDVSNNIKRTHPECFTILPNRRFQHSSFPFSVSKADGDALGPSLPLSRNSFEEMERKGKAKSVDLKFRNAQGTHFTCVLYIEANEYTAMNNFASLLLRSV